MGSKHDYSPAYIRSFMDALSDIPPSAASVSTAAGCTIDGKSTSGFNEAFQVA